MKRFLLLSILLTSVLGSRAQVTVDPSMSPAQLVEEVLLGPGVTASNITFNGVPGNLPNTQIGAFHSVNSNTGLTHGIILATGGVSVAESPNDLPTAHVMIDANDELTQEPDLALIMAPAALHDVAVLEFDFIPAGDTLRFEYVFASEEYNEHTCSAYSDAFGFFISGPGISGNSAYQNNARNVALIPGTQVPVAINTVNQGFAGSFGSNSVCNAASSNWQANSVFFVNNESNSDPHTTQFDGFTVPLSATIPVICGETYRIKIAIADATDRKNDSAVFIKAGSFQSVPPVSATVETLNPDTDGYAVEGCSTYRLHISRKDSTRAQTYYLRTNGLNLPETILPYLPDSVTLYSQDGSKQIDIPTAHNDLNEGERNFGLQVLKPQVCSADTLIISVPLKIRDFPAMELNYPDSIALNCVDTAAVQIAVSGGYPPYSIVWDQPEISGFEFQSAPTGQQIYTAQVHDRCNLNTQPLSITVFRESYPPVSVSLPASISFNCATPVDLYPQISGGFGQYHFEWSQNNVVLSNVAHLNHLINSDAPLNFKVTDLCAPAKVTQVALEAQTNPLFAEIGSDTTAFCTNPFVIVPEVTGGFGTLNYVWKVNHVTSSTGSMFHQTLTETSLINLTISDACGQAFSDSIFVVVNRPGLEVVVPADTSICAQEELVIYPKISGGSSPIKITWNGSERGGDSFRIRPREDTQVVLEVSDACGQTEKRNIAVHIDPVHASFAFNFETDPIGLINRSTPGAYYFWNFKNGVTSTDHTPVVASQLMLGAKVFLTVRNETGCEDEAALLCEPPLRLFIPTAFTPDGDGLNDVFRVKGTFISAFEIEIFDRWGQCVFRADNLDRGWDGTRMDNGYLAETGIYAYKYRATDSQGMVHEQSGSVHLIR